MNGIHHLMTNNSALENFIHMTEDSIAIIERKNDGYVYTYMNESMKKHSGSLLGKEIYEVHPIQFAQQLSRFLKSLDKRKTSDSQAFPWQHSPFY
jgi:hypothetical protein